MAVPDFQSLMLPALKALSDGNEASVSNIRERVAMTEGLSPEDLRELLPSGRQSIFANRVSWAVMYMERAGLAERVRRGVWKITSEGSNLLSDPPSQINMNYLQRYPTYVAWRTAKPSPSTSDEPGSVFPIDDPDTPEEALENAASRIRRNLEAEVLARVREAHPSFLEQVIVDLLISMGYGGGDAKMGHVTGRSGDGGIDGKIKEDALGLDEVYIQAKKYADSNTVGEGDLRNFAGAIDAAGTTKGVYAMRAPHLPAEVLI